MVETGTVCVPEESINACRQISRRRPARQGVIGKENYRFLLARVAGPISVGDCLKSNQLVFRNNAILAGEVPKGIASRVNFSPGEKTRRYSSNAPKHGADAGLLA